MASFTRADVWSLPPGDPIIEYYADAVAAMQLKSATDPTSWAYQAAIHGSSATPAKALWNECRHQGWYFLPWHRAYLYYFERIVRAEVIALRGPKDWALPYWDYDGGSGHNALPPAFRDPTRPNGRPNPLYVATRSLTGSAGLPPAVTSSAAAMRSTVFTGRSEFGGGVTAATDRFAGQTGLLERTPHNDIHNMIGGPMRNPATAARDPIFWLHHCNIDRLWWRWQQTNPKMTQNDWLKQPFSFFDVGGAKVTTTCKRVEDTAASLDYTYSMPSAGPVLATPAAPSAAWPSPWPGPPSREGAHVMAESNAGPHREMVGATAAPVELVGEPVRVAVPVDRRAAITLESVLPAGREHRAFLEIESVDAERNPGTVYAVYVNLPPAPTAADLDTHHVGNVSLFGIERARDPNFDGHSHPLHFSMEITDVLNRLAADASWTQGDALDVTFRPLSLEPPTEGEGAGEVRPESVSAPAAPAAALHEETPIHIGRISVHYQ